jgi:hypothetical protein
VTRYRSPRQRRAVHRERRWQKEQEQRLAEFRETVTATRRITPEALLAQEYGVEVIPWRVRDGDGVSAWWPGGRVVGTLDDVRAALEHRHPATIT